MTHREINTFQTLSQPTADPLQIPSHPISDLVLTCTHPNLDKPEFDFVDSKIFDISRLAYLKLLKNDLKLIEIYTHANFDKLKMDTYPNPYLSKLNSLPKNTNFKNSSNNLLYKLQEIFSEDLAWDTPVVKQFILIYWVKLTIEEKKDSFIPTRIIYEIYNKDFNTLNEKNILPKASFYRLIWNALLTAKIIYVKSQENGQKGIRGIQLKTNEND